MDFGLVTSMTKPWRRTAAARGVVRTAPATASALAMADSTGPGSPGRRCLTPSVATWPKRRRSGIPGQWAGGGRAGGVDDLTGGAEHLGAVGVGGEAFDDAVVHVLSVGQFGQAAEDLHVELVL